MSDALAIGAGVDDPDRIPHIPCPGNNSAIVFVFYCYILFLKTISLEECSFFR
jgi:hypothetical protein